MIGNGALFLIGPSSANGHLHIPSAAGPVPSDWRWARLDSLCEGVFDCPHSTPALTDSGPLVVRSQDIRTGVLKAHEAAHVSEPTYQERISRAEPRWGDLLYSREGTYFGIAAEIPPDTRACLGQRMVLIRPNPQLIQFRYLRFWLNSPLLASHLHGHRDGSVAERLNLPTIRGLPVLLPTYREQLAIARILGSLDDKIELNRKMNETLEAMARALFKSWFIDFDPVRAKADGRKPGGMDEATAKLFPDCFENSDVGAIPKGWQLTSIGDYVELQRGTTYKSSLKDLPGPYLLGLASILRNGGFRSDKLQTYGGDSPQHMLLTPGDLYVSLKDVTQAADFLGAVARVPPDIRLGRLTQDTVKLIVNTNAITSSYLCWALMTPEYRNYCRSHATGTTNLGLSREDFFAYPLVLPSQHVLGRFDGCLAQYDALLNLHRGQSLTLTALRDYLLPKLLTGELRIEDAERFVEAAL
jgi:type I restriction enzyme S subunit